MIRGIACRERFWRSWRGFLGTTNATVHHLPDCDRAEWGRVVLLRIVRVPGTPGRGRKQFVCKACSKALLLLWHEVWRPLPLPIGLLPKVGAGQACSPATEPEQQRQRCGQTLVPLPGRPRVCRCGRRVVVRQVSLCVGLAYRACHASIAARAPANLMGLF